MRASSSYNDPREAALRGSIVAAAWTGTLAAPSSNIVGALLTSPFGLPMSILCI